jgi:hypothetical protein
MITDDDMILNTKDYFVSENTINPRATPDEVAAFLRKNKTTGRVTFEMIPNDGGIRGIQVIERTKCTDTEANEIRRVLGMDYEMEVPRNGHRKPHPPLTLVKNCD